MSSETFRPLIVIEILGDLSFWPFAKLSSTVNDVSNDLQGLVAKYFYLVRLTLTGYHKIWLSARMMQSLGKKSAYCGVMLN